MSITRYELTVHLRTASPLHSGDVEEWVDRTNKGRTEPRRFVRDGANRPVLTGRSVKGAIRAAYEKHYGTDDPRLGRLWGGLSDQGARASALTFHAVDLSGPDAARARADEAGDSGNSALATRMGNAVDRYWGSAGDTALFEHEYIPAGRPLTLRITAQAGVMPPNRPGDPAPFMEAPDHGVGEEDVEDLFAIILGLLKSERVALNGVKNALGGERIAFGGRKNAGWGRVRIDARPDGTFWVLTKTPLGCRDDLVNWLANGYGQDMTGAIEPVDCEDPDRMRITIDWTSPTGILVADPRRSEAEREEQEREKQERAGKPAKGAGGGGEDDDCAAEGIVPAKPMLTGTDEGERLVLPGTSVRGALRSRASRIARTVLARHLPPEKQDDWSDANVHRQLAADPALVRDLFGSTERRGALTVLDTLAELNGSPRRVTHNAGDRWTGGVAEGALYGEEIHDAKWKGIVLELDLGALSEDGDRRKAAWCLLGLVLAELASGTLPLGSRGTRGLGQVEVTGITVEGGRGLGFEDWSLKAPGGGGGGGRPLAQQLLSRLQAVNQGIKANPGANEGWTGWSSYLCDDQEGARNA